MADWGIVATLPGDLPLDDILQVGDALLASPADGVAVTMDGAEWETAVSDLAQRAQGHMRVGVSGWANPEKVRLAAEAGAEFLITPAFDVTTCTACRQHGLLQLPFLSDESELREALQGGAAAAVLADVALVQRAQGLMESGVWLAAGTEAETAVSAFRQAGGAGLLLTDALFTGAEQKMADLITRVRLFRQRWLDAAR